MRNLAYLLVIGLVGCGAVVETAPLDLGEGGAGAGSEVETEEETEGEGGGEAFSALRCAGDREWDLSVSGKALEAFEGSRVWVSAVERAEAAGKDEVVVLLEDRIQGGEFSAACAKGLTTNMNYPAVVVVLDADGSGGCSEGDVQFTGQFYGWNADVSYEFEGEVAKDASGVVSEDALHPVPEKSTFHPETSFCAFYFPG